MVWARMVSPNNCTNTSAADSHGCNINISRNNNAGKLRVNYYIASFFFLHTSANRRMGPLKEIVA